MPNVLGVALSLGDYLLGSGATLLVAGALALGSWSVRAALMPEWEGVPARLAESVLWLGSLLGAGFVVGTFGAFSALPVLGTCLVVAAGMVLVARPLQAAPPAAPRVPTPVLTPVRLEVVLALGAIAVVAFGWLSQSFGALQKGMTEGDTLWYHGTFAARFVQERSLWILPAVGDDPQNYFPHNTQALHALAFLPFRRDLLSPLLNLGFGWLALAASFCVGRRRGLGWLTLLGGALVLGLPTLVGTHPGQATNDVACAALLLAALALLIEGGLRTAPTAIAAIAAGLSLGTKLTAALPVLVITVAVLVLAARARRVAPAVAWCIGLLGAGSFWFVRTWSLAGSPLPWVELDVGPLHLPAKIPHAGGEIVSELGTPGIVGDVFVPGLHRALGPVWPVVVVLVLVGIALMLVPRRSGLERTAGAAALAALVGYLVTPYTMGFGGALFVQTVRYSTPLLLLGVVLAPLTVGVRRRPRLVLGVVMAAVVLVDVLAPRGPRVSPFDPDGAVAAALVLVLVAIVTGLVVRPGRRDRRGLAVLAVGASAAVIAVGWWVQADYLEGRYRSVGLPLDVVNEGLEEVRGADVVVFATLQHYPLMGEDLSNSVELVPAPAPDAAGGSRCRAWLRAVDDRDPGYVVFGNTTFLEEVPEPEWFASQPSVHEVARDGDIVLFRVDGELDPDRCPAEPA